MRFLGYFLQFLGAMALIGVVAFFGNIFFDMRPKGDDLSLADADDLEFVLNRGGLDSTQELIVVSSYRSGPHPLLGDFREHHCVEISSFEPDERHMGDWVFGREQDQILNSARNLAAGVGNLRECFGEEVSATSPDVAAYIWRISTHGRSPGGVTIIFYHQPTSRLLYVSFET